MATFIIIFVIVAVIGHLAGGLFHHGRNRRRGHSVNIGWSLRRGWWASDRFLGGTYYHDL